MKNAPQPDNVKQTSGIQNKILIILFIFYVVAVWAGILNHEPWRDEGNDWMMVRDVSFAQLVEIYIPNVGHPPMYYFLMFPFTRMGFPLITVNYISFISMALSLYIILFRIKYPFVFKVAIIFSYFFFYEFAVIGRNYCLAVLFVVLITWFYPRRFEKPWIYALLIVGLFNAESLMFPFAGCLAALYCWELYEQKLLNAKYLLPALLIAIGGGYIIPYIAIPGLKLRAHTLEIQDHGEEMVKVISSAFGIYMKNDFFIIIYLLLLALLIKKPKAMLLALGGTLGIIYLLSYKYLSDIRHRGLVMVELVSCYGIALYYKDAGIAFLKDKLVKVDLVKIGCYILSFFLFYESYIGILTMQSDLQSNFSGGKDAAAFIEEQNLENKIMIGHMSWAAGAVLQHLPKDKKMFYADCMRYGSFMEFDSLYEANQFAFGPDYAPYVAETKFKDSLHNVILVMNMPIQDPHFTEDWKLIYATPEEPMKRQESYLIYEYAK